MIGNTRIEELGVDLHFFFIHSAEENTAEVDRPDDRLRRTALQPSPAAQPRVLRPLSTRPVPTYYSEGTTQADTRVPPMDSLTARLAARLAGGVDEPISHVIVNEVWLAAVDGTLE